MKNLETETIVKTILDNFKEYTSKPDTNSVSIDPSNGNLYTLAVQAYIYAFPWLYLSQLQWLWTTKPGAVQQFKESGFAIYAPLNNFWLAPGLASSDNSTGGSPNADTIYSLAWCDLSQEPIVISVPEITDRYYCIELTGIDSDTYGYVGTRETGSTAGNYLLAGPNWHGDIASFNEGKDISEQIQDILPRAFYNSILLMGRTGLTTGTDEDIQISLDIQENYRLTTLSDWISGENNSTSPKAPIPVGTTYNDTLGAWYTINKMMTQYPPGVHPSIAQDQLVNLFAQIEIGPNQDISTQSPENLLVLQQAAKDALLILKVSSGNANKVVNGWGYPPVYIGKAGQYGDYLARSSFQALAGITAHWTIEAVYLNTKVDCNGQSLSGGINYTMEFTEDSFPPFESNFHGFWSITLYNFNYEIIANSEAYTINSNFTQYQARNKEEGMTILLQQDQPENWPEDNEDGIYWLQTPMADQDGNDGFYMVLRVYIPAPSVATTQTWEPPSVTPSD